MKKYNTDIILKDRRNEFIDNNLSLCENNCNYKGYDNNTKKVLCECFIKIKFPLISEIVINRDRLLNNFKDIKNIININIMKCYYTLFTKIGLIKNIGNYIMSILIIFTIILAILFKLKGYNQIILLVNEIIKKINKCSNQNLENININNIEKNNDICNIYEEENDKKIIKIKNNNKKELCLIIY